MLHVCFVETSSWCTFEKEEEKSSRCIKSVLKKRPHGAVLGMKENSHYGAKILFWEKHHYGALAISNQHQCDVLPKQNVKIYGRNVTMVLTFFFFEPQRGSRGHPKAFLDCLVYSFHFRFSGVATYKPSLGPFFWSKVKKTLNAHISKSRKTPKWRPSKTLQLYSR